VQVIAAVECRKESRWVLRIAKNNVKIDDTVKLTAVPNPSVDFLPHGFLFRRVVTGPYGGAFERAERRTRDPDPAPTGLRDQLPIAVNDLARPHNVGRRRKCPWEADIIDAESQDPSFVTVTGGRPRRAKPARAQTPVSLPDPVCPKFTGTYDIFIPGVGGTGVVTVGALLGMAAHLENKPCSILDQPGMAQKGVCFRWSCMTDVGPG
jgi:hypothetical protein